MEIIGFTLQTLGEVLVALTVLFVHQRVIKEHKIDEKVFLDIKKERVIGTLGIIFIITGYFLQLPLIK